MVDIPLILRDGAILAVVASIWVMGALRANPRWFLRHYPKEIRAVVTPVTRKERIASRLVSLPFLALIIGIPIWSTLSFVDRHPGADFFEAMLHGFGVSMVFNIVDLVVLDMLWLGVFRPAWAMVPDAESVVFQFNLADHLRGFAVGTVLAVVLGCLGAAVAGAAVSRGSVRRSEPAGSALSVIVFQGTARLGRGCSPFCSSTRKRICVPVEFAKVAKA